MTFRRFSLVAIIGVLTAATAIGSETLDANIYVKLSKKVVPSVVNISTLSRVRGNPYAQGAPNDPFRQFFEEFFGGMPPNLGPGPQGGRGGMGGDDAEEGRPAPRGRPGGPGPQAPQAMSLGTGFIIDSSGLILTNNHVVADADEIKIAFTEEADEKPTDGEVVGRDPEMDLALIRVKTTRKLIPIPLGDSDALEVGEYVMAVGNPFGQGHSVTHGIISAKGRRAPEFQLANYLQTDAPINPGNSGGPLLNLRGEVIGINNAIDQRAQGIGFAIPINAVKEVLPQLKTKGSVSRGYIGVLVGELTPEVAEKLGVQKDLMAPFVTHVYPNEPADLAKVKPYDVIIEFNGKKILNASDLVSAVVSVPVNGTGKLVVLRGKERKELTIKVIERPSQTKLAQKKKPRTPPSPQPENVQIGMILEDLNSPLAQEMGLSAKVRGIVVTNVEYSGPADQAGLLRGDIIMEVDRKAVADVDAFMNAVRGKKSVMVRVRRFDPQGREFFSVHLLNLKP